MADCYGFHWGCKLDPNGIPLEPGAVAGAIAGIVIGFALLWLMEAKVRPWWIARGHDWPFGGA